MIALIWIGNKPFRVILENGGGGGGGMGQFLNPLAKIFIFYEEPPLEMLFNQPKISPPPNVLFSSLKYSLTKDGSNIVKL